jgi:hypothetical protein
VLGVLRWGEAGANRRSHGARQVGEECVQPALAEVSCKHTAERGLRASTHPEVSEGISHPEVVEIRRIRRVRALMGEVHTCRAGEGIRVAAAHGSCVPGDRFRDRRKRTVSRDRLHVPRGRLRP